MAPFTRELYENNVQRWSNLVLRAFGARGRSRVVVSNEVQTVYSLSQKSPIEYDDGPLIWFAAGDSWTAPAARFAGFTIVPPVGTRMVLDSIRLSASVAGNIAMLKQTGTPTAPANPLSVGCTAINTASPSNVYDFGITRGDYGATITTGMLQVSLPNAATVEALTDPVVLDGTRGDSMITRMGGVVSAVTLAIRGRFYPDWPE